MKSNSKDGRLANVFNGRDILDFDGMLRKY